MPKSRRKGRKLGFSPKLTPRNTACATRPLRPRDRSLRPNRPGCASARRQRRVRSPNASPRQWFPTTACVLDIARVVGRGLPPRLRPIPTPVARRTRASNVRTIEESLTHPQRHAFGDETARISCRGFANAPPHTAKRTATGTADPGTRPAHALPPVGVPGRTVAPTHALLAGPSKDPHK